MTEDEKNASIEYILSRGLVKPQSARKRITEMIRAMGFRFIFWDMGYSLLFSLLSLAVVILLFSIAPEHFRCSAAVACAPMLFLLISLFAETTERALSLFDLKQTCRYTVSQITTLRVICYSFAGMIFTLVVAALSAENVYEFLSLFPLCLSALFLCAVLEVCVMRVMRGKWANALYSFVWICVNTVLLLSPGKTWENILRGMPLAISLALAVISISLFAFQISKTLSEVKKHALA